MEIFFFFNTVLTGLSREFSWANNAFYAQISYSQLNKIPRNRGALIILKISIIFYCNFYVQLYVHPRSISASTVQLVGFKFKKQQ